MTERCENCKWWEMLSGEDPLVIGSCEKHGNYSEAHDCCGEFTPKGKEEDHDELS